jgi:GTP-binding protein Era
MSYRAGFAGLIGLPNSGKSTLLNLLVGEKISIVTAKPQTTRRRVMGIHNDKDMQAVLVDAPGVVKASTGLNKFLREEALDVISQSDVLIAVLNIDEAEPENLEELLLMVKESGKPWMAVINKTDLPQMHRVRILREKIEALNVPVVAGSSLKEGEPLKESLFAALRPLLPAADKPLYEDDLYTLSTVRELCSEIIREKCFESLHQEIPFQLAVRIMRFIEDDGPMVRIEAEIVTGKENHKPIVVGRGGQVLKVIGTEARKEIQKLIGRKVFLDLKVTANPNWQKNPTTMKELGYVHLQA